jgi:kynurenine formamidase
MPMPNPATLPTFDQLPFRAGAPEGSSWGLWGDDDELGTWNLVTPEKTARAAGLVRKGSVFALNLPLDAMPARPMFWFRGNPRHTIFDCSGGLRVSYDEYLDAFCPQSSSQWDGHRHVAHPVLGFYNGFKHEDVIHPDSAKLGIQNLAKKGIATRGVLLDVARYLEHQGQTLDQGSDWTIEAATLDACAAAQGVTLEPGDILLFRTGWLGWLRAQPATVHNELAEELHAPGLLAGRDMAAWLWDHHVASVATDAIAVESWPPAFADPARGFFHIQLITLFGMNLGELWDLDALAEDCAADGVYEFFFTSAPLNITGGVGSPPNALAIK